MKRTLAMILTLALFFAGCGGKTIKPEGELPADQTNAEHVENLEKREEDKAETGKDSWISPVIEWFSSLFDSPEGGDSPEEGANASTIPDRSIPTGLLWLDLAVTEEEISGVPGMNKAAAASVYGFLHGDAQEKEPSGE